MLEQFSNPGDSGVQLSRLLLAVQTSVKMLGSRLAQPGGLDGASADQLWLDQLIKSRSLAYLVSSAAQVRINTFENCFLWIFDREKSNFFSFNFLVA